MKPHTGPVSSLSRSTQARALDAGRMPSQNVLSRLANIGPTAELSLSKLRLLAISYPIDGSPEDLLSSEQLTDLRVFTGSRVVYGLTVPGIAGAVAQTHLFDYRRHAGAAHFGPPLSSVEILLKGHSEDSGIERAVEGQVGPIPAIFQCICKRLTFVLAYDYWTGSGCAVFDGSCACTIPRRQYIGVAQINESFAVIETMRIQVENHDLYETPLGLFSGILWKHLDGFLQIYSSIVIGNVI